MLYLTFVSGYLNDEHKLYDRLTDATRYNRFMRPVSSVNETLNVAFGLALIQIYGLVSFLLFL